MSAYKVKLLSQAQRFYKNTDEKNKERLKACFIQLEANPFYGRRIKMLKGKLKGYFRYRIGDLRVIYEINRKTREVGVLAILPRKDAY